MSEEKKQFVGGSALLDAEPRRKLVGFGAEPPPAAQSESQPTESSQPAVSWQPSEQPRGGPVSWQLTESSQPDTGSQPTAGQSTQGSQLTESSQPDTSSQPTAAQQETAGILASVPEIEGHTPLPHRYADHLCRWLSPDEQAVYTQLYRLSWGWGKETCFISNPRLSERSNVPLSTMKRVVQKLVDKRLIEKTGGDIGYGKEQGSEYRVLRLSSQPAVSSRPALSSQLTAGTNKYKDLKEINKGGLCARCKDTSGFVYADKSDPSKGVRKCTHDK